MNVSRKILKKLLFSAILTIASFSTANTIPPTVFYRKQQPIPQLAPILPTMLPIVQRPYYVGSRSQTPSRRLPTQRFEQNRSRSATPQPRRTMQFSEPLVTQERPIPQQEPVFLRAPMPIQTRMPVNPTFRPQLPSNPSLQALSDEGLSDDESDDPLIRNTRALDRHDAWLETQQRNTEKTWNKHAKLGGRDAEFAEFMRQSMLDTRLGNQAALQYKLAPELYPVKPAQPPSAPAYDATQARRQLYNYDRELWRHRLAPDRFPAPIGPRPVNFVPASGFEDPDSPISSSGSTGPRFIPSFDE